MTLCAIFHNHVFFCLFEKLFQGQMRAIVALRELGEDSKIIYIHKILPLFFFSFQHTD